MTCSRVQGEKIYCVVPSSLKSPQFPPRQAHSWGPLWVYSPHTDGPWEPPCRSRNESRWLDPAVRGCGWRECWSVRLRPSLTGPFSHGGPLAFPQYHPEALELQPGRGHPRQTCYSYRALIRLCKEQCSEKQEYWWLVWRVSNLHELITDRLIHWLTAFLKTVFLEVLHTCDADTQAALPPLQEASASSLAPHADFRSNSDSHAESIWL